MKKLVVLGCLFFMLLGSCNVEPCINKAYFVGTYKNFIKAIEKEKLNYSESDWLSKDKKIRGFVNDCYPAHSEAMSQEDKANFWTSYVKYMIVRHKAKALQAIEKEDSLSTVNIYDEILSSVEDMDIQKLLKDIYGKDIEIAIDDVLDKLESFGDKLKDWLNSTEN